MVRGEFWIAGSKVVSPGTLEWTFESGASLELIGDSDGWPTDLGRFHHVVHGVLDAGEDVTLFDAGVRSLTLGRRPTALSGNTLIWGANTTPDFRWARAVYETANLAGWVADNGLEAHFSRKRQMDGVVIKEARNRPVTLPRADAFLATEVDVDPFVYQASWSVTARQRLVVDARRKATLDALHSRYFTPLLCLLSFVSDRPDCVTTEIVLNPSTTERAEVWRAGPRFDSMPWRPGKDYLFQADDLPRLGAAFSKWWRRHAESPALGLFADHINLGFTYSQPRYLTLYSALEGYCRQRVGRNNLRQLRDYAGVNTAAHGCTNRALRLIGASRDYVAHFTIRDIPAATIIDSLVDTTRCGHALLQCCLLREMGFGGRQTEQIMARHHLSWPLPTF